MPPVYWSTGIQWSTSSGSEQVPEVAGGAEPEEVPARVHERVHRVGVARAVAAAAGTRRVDERRDVGEGRAAAPLKWTSSGARRGAVVGHRHLAALRAVHDRDRRAPVALPADPPVAQPVVHLGHAEASLASQSSTFAIASATRGRRRTRVDLHAVARVRLGIASGSTASAPVGLDHDADREAVRRAKSQSRWSCAGDRHDRAGAVAHEHVGREEERHLAVERIHGARAEAHALLRRSAAARLVAVSRASRPEAADLRPRAPSSTSWSTSGCSGAKTE